MVDIPDSHLDLLQAPVGVLATQGADGYPQVSALWFIYTEGIIEISLNSSRQKTKNLARHPECTLLILDLSNPYRTIEIRARADVRPDTERRAIAEVQEKYGMDVREHDRPGEDRMIVTLQPVKVNTWG